MVGSTKFKYWCQTQRSHSLGRSCFLLSLLSCQLRSPKAPVPLGVLESPRTCPEQQQNRWGDRGDEGSITKHPRDEESITKHLGDGGSITKHPADGESITKHLSDGGSITKYPRCCGLREAGTECSVPECHQGTDLRGKILQCRKYNKASLAVLALLGHSFSHKDRLWGFTSVFG